MSKTISNIKAMKRLAIAVIILGSIHVCATPMVIMIFPKMPIMQTMAFGYMYVMTGIAIIFVGCLQLTILKLVEQNRAFLRLLRYTVAFIALSGVGAVVTMFDNPFAYISLLLTLLQVIYMKKLSMPIQNTI